MDDTNATSLFDVEILCTYGKVNYK